MEAGEGARDGSGYTLVVAIANPDHVSQLMRTANDLAIDRNGRIRVVSVVHKPTSSPFHLFEDERIREEFAHPQQAALERAMDVAEDASVPVNSSLPVGDDISKTILGVIDEFDADGLLLGWQERSRPSDLVLGTTVDPLVRRAPCDVFVERIGRTADGVDSVFVPTDGGPHAELAAALAGAIARSNDASVEVGSFVTGYAESEAEDHVRATATALDGVDVDEWIAEVDAVPDAIVDTAAGHDIVILGATRERRIRRRVVGSVARDVAERVSVPIVIARAWSEPTWLERLVPW